MAYLGTDTWDTREAYLEWVGKIARGTVNLSVQNAVFCRELDAAIERMERIGCTLKQPDGTYYRTTSMGQPGPYFINFNGKQLKPLLAREAKTPGRPGPGEMRHFRTSTHDGDRVDGCGRVQYPDGNVLHHHGQSGHPRHGQYEPDLRKPTGLPFNTWQCPANTGAAQAMAFEAGAKLANMEIVRITLVPRGFSAAGLNALTGWEEES